MRFHLKSFKRSEIRSTNRYQHRDIMTLLRLFRLAVLLNRPRQATVEPKSVKLTVTNNEWLLQFEASFLRQNPLILAELEEEQKCLVQLDLTLKME
ncbi:exopolyphosphatase [Actinobacillus ureae]|nr:exopolyphosphatase [Actinobacillus ureae]